MMAKYWRRSEDEGTTHMRYEDEGATQREWESDLLYPLGFPLLVFLYQIKEITQLPGRISRYPMDILYPNNRISVFFMWVRYPIRLFSSDIYPTRILLDSADRVDIISVRFF